MRSFPAEESHGDLPKNFLRPCILLLLKEKEGHGYNLLERLAEFEIPSIDPGGVYRALRILEREGLVTSWWETSIAGPARRTYALTQAGELWLNAQADTLHATRWILERFLLRYGQAVGGVRLEEREGV